MRVGDTVEVYQTVFEGMIGHDEWKLAVVIAIGERNSFGESNSFLVKALKGDFDGHGHSEMWLQFRDRGRAWR